MTPPADEAVASILSDFLLDVQRGTGHLDPPTDTAYRQAVQRLRQLFTAPRTDGEP